MKFIFALVLCLFVGTASGSNYYNNSYHNNDVVVLQKQVLFDSRYFLGVNGYYQVGQDIQQKAQQSKYDELNSRISNLEGKSQLLEKQNQTLLQKIGPGPIAPPQPTPEPTPTPTPDPTPTPPTSENPPDQPIYTPTQLDKQVYQIFNTKCITCHGADAKAGLQLVKDGSLLKPDLSDMVEIYDRVNGVDLHGKARMPKGKPPLPTSDVNIIKAWMVEEANNLRK